MVLALWDLEQISMFVRLGSTGYLCKFSNWRIKFKFLFIIWDLSTLTSSSKNLHISQKYFPMQSPQLEQFCCTCQWKWTVFMPFVQPKMNVPETLLVVVLFGKQLTSCSLEQREQITCRSVSVIPQSWIWFQYWNRYLEEQACGVHGHSD